MSAPLLDPILECVSLSKSVSDSSGLLTLLDNVNFHVSQGETLAITGASGSGKSTLLGLMAGLDLPSSGHINLLGQNLSILNEDQRAQLRAKLLGFVFQSFQLLPHFTALENVMLPLELVGRPARAAALDILDQVGLKDRASHYPRTLSGGEQQRVALARAFVIEPKLLLADEPTGSLDTVTGEKVMQLMFDLQSRLNNTLVLVTHDPSLAARCKRQLSLSAGRLVSVEESLAV